MRLDKLWIRLNPTMVVNIFLCEIVWRIYVYNISYRDPLIKRVNFHLSNEHIIYFQDNETLDSILDKKDGKKTMFLAWIEANVKYEKAKNFSYAYCIFSIMFCVEK
ncbi:hypothetical protein L6164_017079 [Bauhinia variegata]|uniref:Uncharacterized protein n=1 Tax=Bauhinia variegata TaxID=167791 RepID=A0ACB9NAD9_BAUVA|nr:hypothetical protein L6164_017079 [Bauhinia variegata]